MSISLKAELEIWVAALEAYDDQDFEKALELFSGIADSSKILTNMGLIYATIGEHEIAVDHFVSATSLDSYLAIAHFQCGVSNFLLDRHDHALVNFEDAYLYLRGNEAINYDQIGLRFKLFSAEILFNKGLTQLNMGYIEEGIADMQEASRQKVTDEHGVIDEAIRDRGEGYTVFSIPVGVLYRPSDSKIKNAKSKDYLGKAKLVAASDSNDAFTEFTGAKKLKQNVEENSDIKEDGSLVLGESTPIPPGIEPIATRHTALERSKTTPQRNVGNRPSAATTLSSRRTQSVSNPPNAPAPTGISRSNTVSGRTNTPRVAGSAMTSSSVAPLRIKTSKDTVVSAGGTTAMEGAVAAAGGNLTVPHGRPGLRRAQGSGMSQPVLQPVPQLHTVSIQPAQYMISPQDAIPLVLPITPAPKRAKGHLTQFYETYMDVYTDDPAPRFVMSRPHSHSQEWEQELPASLPSLPSPVSMSSHGHANTQIDPSSSDPCIAPNKNLVGVNGNVSVHPRAGTDNSGSVALSVSTRRKPTRRPVAHGGGTGYSTEDDDEGFVTGDFDVLEMAKIRVKLHYQDDVRGMTMPPSSSFDAFVKRVTAKFGTSLMGLEMKFVDEEGTKISLRDEGDFELAIETARGNAKGKSEGKIEVWCMDV